MSANRQHAHFLLDQLGSEQLAAIVHLLETMVPAEEDIETLSATERKAVGEADEWLKHNAAIPYEDVLEDFGLTAADWERWARSRHPKQSRGAMGRQIVWSHQSKSDLRSIVYPLRCR